MKNHLKEFFASLNDPVSILLGAVAAIVTALIMLLPLLMDDSDLITR